ncbi:uncharacterized protein LOC114965441 [Acropora millepora]|uniref:uncharacterized protein LOC114965441 n=1 Tax=Acropora millepora TaxID=45264 RepID=UPI001CF5D0E8|nr:uncharacterized protein LOC114965441 [Acropora millepora]
MEIQLAVIHIHFTFISTLIYIETTSSSQVGEYRQLFFPAKFTFDDRRLMKHIIATLKVLDVDLCELQCYLQPNCVSINFSVIPDSAGLHECELNNATHRSHEIDLQNKDGYVYKGAESACDRATCENGGTCQSGFTDKGYHCVCPPGFTSAHCEQDDKMQHDGKETSSHIDDITNEDPTRGNANMTLPLKLTSAAPTTVIPGDDEDENDQDNFIA